MMGELPIACELTSAEIAARRTALLPGLLEKAVEQTPLPNRDYQDLSMQLR